MSNHRWDNGGLYGWLERDATDKNEPPSSVVMCEWKCPHCESTLRWTQVEGNPQPQEVIEAASMHIKSHMRLGPGAEAFERDLARQEVKPRQLVKGPDGVYREAK